MIRVIFIFLVVVFFSSKSMGQCSIEKYDYVYDLEFYNNFRKDSLYIVGGYLHGVDSVFIWKNDQLIHSEKIWNNLALTDGVSFSDLISNETKILKVQLDECYHTIKIPIESKRISLHQGKKAGILLVRIIRAI